MTVWTIGVLLLGCDAEWSKRVADTAEDPVQDQDGDGYIAEEDVADGDAGLADCDDLNPSVNPDGTESCNGRDDDCDGLIDEEDSDVVLLVWARDADSDGYGDPAVLSESCEQPAGSVLAAGGADCDDADPEINPGARERCDELGALVDEDCDGLVDGEDPDLDPASRPRWLLDEDGDGFGSPAAPVLSCEGIEGYLLESDPTDCDDADPESGPCFDPGRLGFALTGLGAGSGAGGAVDGAGDVDGDGLADLIIGAPGDAGGAWLVLGPVSEGGRLSTLGIALTGDGDQAGAAVAGVGDLDGDGLDDVVVGAWRALDGAGAIAVLRWPVEASALSDAADRREGVNAGDFLGASIDGAGDVDGDGLADLIVGIPGADEAWLMHGPVVGVSGPEGARLSGARWAGAAVAGVGDLNGDGLDDVAVGALGAVAVLAGPVVDTDWSDADALWVGEEDAGRALASGDIDGDGRSELLVGQGTVADGFPGRVYVLYDALAGGALADADAIEGADRDEAWRLEGVGDLDGDGFGELIVGAPGRGGGGAVHIIYGPVEGVLALGDAWPVFSGTAERDALGASVSGGLDADGDGLLDVLLGAPGVSEGGEGAGAVYLIPGSTLATLPPL